MTSISTPTAMNDTIRSMPATRDRSTTKSFTTSYSRQWSDRANPLLRFTLGGITANYAFNQTDGRNPNSVTTLKGTAAAVNYGITPRDLMILRVPLTKTRLYLLPERFYWNYNVNTSEQLVYDRIENASKLALRSDVNGRTSFINFGADTRPLDFMHHHFEAVRNLTLPDEQREQFGIVNLGKVVTWRQNMDARFSLNRGPTHQLIATKEVSVSEPMQGKTAYAGVIAANVAIEKMLRALAAFAVGAAD